MALEIFEGQRYLHDLTDCEEVVKRVASPQFEQELHAHVDKLVGDDRGQACEMGKLIKSLLCADPAKRMTAAQALAALAVRDGQSRMYLKEEGKARKMDAIDKIDRYFDSMERHQLAIIRAMLTLDVADVPHLIILLPNDLVSSPQGLIETSCEKCVPQTVCCHGIKTYYRMYICDEGPSLGLNGESESEMRALIPINRDGLLVALSDPTLAAGAAPLLAMTARLAELSSLMLHMTGSNDPLLGGGPSRLASIAQYFKDLAKQSLNAALPHALVAVADALIEIDSTGTFTAAA